MAGFEESDLYAAFGLDQPAGENDPAPAEPGQAAQTQTTEPQAGGGEQQPAQAQEQDPSQDQGDGEGQGGADGAGDVSGAAPAEGGQEGEPASKPSSSPRKGDAASVMGQSPKRLPSGRRMPPAGDGKSSRQPLTPP